MKNRHNLKILDDYCKQQSSMLNVGGVWVGDIMSPFSTSKERKEAEKILLANGFVMTSAFSAEKIK